MEDDRFADPAEQAISRRRRSHAMERLVGEAPALRKVVEQVPRFAESDATVLIVGETGTGKELVARALHYLSARAPHPFVAVNCAALPDTLLESELFGHERGAFTDAHGQRQGLLARSDKGTMFLDEVESLTPRGQGTLLRVLQDRTFRPLGSDSERRVDVRFLAATNIDLADLVRMSAFRADLLYRLRVLWLDLPPLRERASDIPLLASHFIEKHAKPGRPAPALSGAASNALLQSTWPGNVRELENAVVRGLHLAEHGLIEPDHLGLTPALEISPIEPRPPETRVPLKESKRQCLLTFERDYLTRLMAECQGNVTIAARRAQKERRELGKLLKKHGLDARNPSRTI